MVDYLESAKALVEERLKNNMKNIEVPGTQAFYAGNTVEEKKAAVEKWAEHEMKVAETVAKAMAEKGSAVFQNPDPGRIEEIFKEEALKDGLLVKNSIGEKFSTGGYYGVMNDLPFYNMAVGIASKRLDMDIEQGKLPASAKNDFYNAGFPHGGSGQALFAMKSSEKANLEEGKTAGYSKDEYTSAVQRGSVLTVYNPNKQENGVCSKIKNFVQQENGDYKEISTEEAGKILASEKQAGKDTSISSLKCKEYKDVPGHFAIRDADGNVTHFNLNSGKVSDQFRLDRNNNRIQPVQSNTIIQAYVNNKQNS